MIVIFLHEIEPIVCDVEAMTAEYVSCDICGESASADFMNSVPHREWYRWLGEDLIVCGNCVPKITEDAET